jgi:hypothetical protein
MTHGGAGVIGRFSASHAITTATAWTAALILMALGEVVARTAVLGVRAYAPSVSLATTRVTMVPGRYGEY